MKISISAALFLASVGSASAFVPAKIGTGIAAPLAMVNLNNQRETLGGVGMDVKNVLENKNKNDKPVTPPTKGPIKSQAIPFVNAPLALDGSMAGDVGFDPLGFADSPKSLKKYREAEIAHARLAMLAAAGWPLSELWDKKIAAAIGLNPVLDASGRVPAVLNGGMGKISPFYWFGVVLFAGVAELITDNFRKKKGYTEPGMFGFDPLSFYPKGEEDRKWMRTAEIKNGRLAMLAITGFAFQEFYTHLAIIDQSPLFFHPISPQVLMDQQTAGEAIKAAMNGGVSAVTSSADGFSAFDVPVPVEAAPATIVEAAPSAAATIVENAPDVVSEASVTVEATVATPLPAVEAASNAATIAPSANMEELIAAKQRIIELEDKLAAIQGLAR